MRAISLTALSLRSSMTRCSLTSDSSPRALSRSASCPSARTLTLQTSLHSVIPSRPWFSRRRTRTVVWSCPRSVPSTSVLGTASRRSSTPARTSRARLSRLSRAASSSTSACVASCPLPSSTSVASRTSPPTWAPASSPRHRDGPQPQQRRPLPSRRARGVP